MAMVFAAAAAAAPPPAGGSSASPPPNHQPPLLSPPSGGKPQRHASAAAAATAAAVAVPRPSSGPAAIADAGRAHPQTDAVRRAARCPCHRLAERQSATSSATVSSNNTAVADAAAVATLRHRLGERTRAKAERDRLRQWCGERIRTLREEEGRRIRTVSGSNSIGGGNVPSGGTSGDDESASVPSSSRQRLTHLRSRSDALRTDLDVLRTSCSEVSVRVAALTVRNDSRDSAIRSERVALDASRDGLERVWDAVLGRPGEEMEIGGDSSGQRQQLEGGAAVATAGTCTGAGSEGRGSGSGSLPDAIEGLASEVRKLRFSLALQAFDVHRIDVGPDYTRDDEGGQSDDNINDNDAATSSASTSTGSRSRRRQQGRRVPRGVGKIGGLPLPHAGPALYGVLPPPVLASSLRLLASLASTLARCLGIVLPHPILLRPLVVNVKQGSGSSGSGKGSGSGAYRAAALAKAQRSQCGDIAESADLVPGWDDALTFAEEEEEDGDNNSRSAAAGAGTGPGGGGVAPSAHSAGIGRDAMPPPPPPASSSPAAALSLVSSTSSLISLGRTTARWALARATGGGGGVAGGGGNDAPSVVTGSERAGSGGSSGAPPSPTRDGPVRRPRPPTAAAAVVVPYRSPPMDVRSVSVRVRHATAAVVKEGHGTAGVWGGGEYALVPPGWVGVGVGSADGPSSQTNAAAAGGTDAAAVGGSSSSPSAAVPIPDDPRAAEERFATGLQLLQNDVVALCIRAGVPVSEMWPAEAPLLNLNALRDHLRSTG